jgi:hypothetical protein
MTRYIKSNGTCDTRNDFTRKYVQEKLVYKKIWKFRLSHQKRDRGDNTVGLCDTEQYMTSMRDFWHFLPKKYYLAAAAWQQRGSGGGRGGGSATAEGSMAAGWCWQQWQLSGGSRSLAAAA